MIFLRRQKPPSLPTSLASIAIKLELTRSAGWCGRRKKPCEGPQMNGTGRDSRRPSPICCVAMTSFNARTSVAGNGLRSQVSNRWSFSRLRRGGQRNRPTRAALRSLELCGRAIWNHGSLTQTPRPRGLAVPRSMHESELRLPTRNDNLFDSERAKIPVSEATLWGRIL